MSHFLFDRTGSDPQAGSDAFIATKRAPSEKAGPCERLRASSHPCATVDGARHLEAGSRTGIGRGDEEYAVRTASEY